jgi:hypothetical protein
MATRVIHLIKSRTDMSLVGLIFSVSFIFILISVASFSCFYLYCWFRSLVGPHPPNG